MSMTDEQIRKIESTCWSRPGFGARFDRWKFARAIESAATAPLLERIAQLEAARFAYASEFCLNEEGQPDKGSIHQNIRALKAKCAEIERELEAVRKDAERYLYLRDKSTASFWCNLPTKGPKQKVDEHIDAAIGAAMKEQK